MMAKSLSSRGVTKAHLLCVLAGLVCAALFSLLSPVPEVIEAHTQAPQHHLFHVVNSNCDPSGCDSENPDHGHSIKCGKKCTEKENTACCSKEADVGCIKCF